MKDFGPVFLILALVTILVVSAFAVIAFEIFEMRADSLKSGQQIKHG